MVTSPLVRTPKELLKSPSFLLKRLGAMAKDKTSEEFERAGATAYSYGVLAVLEEGTRETQATIADALCWDRSYLVGLLDLLEENGMVERKRDTVDRRRHVVSMTDKGRAELERLREVHDRVDEAIFAPLTAAEKKTLQALLAKLAAAQDPRYQN